MKLQSTILATNPTSYWPLGDAAGSNRIRDECGRHDGEPFGVDLAEVPFGAERMPHFNGRLGTVITIPNDERYSHAYANALTVACWIAPSTLDFRYTDGSEDQYVYLISKARNYNSDVEWGFKLYNATNPQRRSRLSFYLYNLGQPTGNGAGAYMEYGQSCNDQTPVRSRQWLFLVGQGEGWIDGSEQCRGAILYKQAVMAQRSPGDKYNNPPNWTIRPRPGPGVITLGGSIGKTAFCGAIGHVALWNRLVTADEVTAIFTAGQAELTAAEMGKG